MLLKKKRQGRQGQSLVEYALLLSLVAVVVIAIGAVLGMAVTRGVALVAGALGAQKIDYNYQSCSTDCIDINQADCFIYVPGNNTQITITVNTGASITSPSDLTASSPNGILTAPFIPGNGNGNGTSNSYSQQTILPGVNPAGCPSTVVVQSKRATGIHTVSITTQTS